IHYFFFFQAEDGIRDFHVTGVQTCALPIWTPSRPSRPVIVPASPGCSAPSSDSRHGRGSLRPCAINLFCEGTNMSKKILVLPGDGIGPEIMTEAVKVLQAADEKYGLDIELSHDELGGAAIDKYGVPLADETLERARQSDAILLGAVGGPKWDTIDPAIRPERGLLKIRS